MHVKNLGALRAVTAGLCLALGGCQALEAPRAGRAELQGRVEHAVRGDAGIVVVALARHTGRIAHRAFLATDRAYTLPLPAGHYKVYAFADQDGDGALDTAEPRSVIYALAASLRPGERRELPPLTLQ